MKITKEQKARILELDPKFFTKELELGKWYKDIFGEEGVFIFFESLNESGNIKGYGFNREGWYDDRCTACHYGKLTEVSDWTLATYEEVEEALIKEAKKRVYTAENTKCLLGLDNGKVTGEFTFYCPNILYSSLDGEGGKVLFYAGKWAEIIETDKYYKDEAHLYKVSLNGYCICVTTADDYVGIKRCSESLPFNIKAEEATEQEFEIAYKSITERLNSLKND